LFSFGRLSHIALELQQPAHDVPPHEHMPFEHVSAEPHGRQAAPPVPHSDPVCDAYGTQVLPAQQPFAQELPLHTH
jgi:hypothetical protein